MLSSIHPFGERARHHRYWATVAWFVVGATLGGGALGAITAALASLWLVTVGPAPAAAGVVLAVASIWDVVGGPVPSIRRQVDEAWLGRYRGWVYGLGYGAQLGFGYVIYVRTALTYALTVSSVLLGSPRVAFVAATLFGLSRGVLIILGSGLTSPVGLRSFFHRFAAAANGVRWAGGAVVGAALVLGVVA
jgi:hypothetical protein